MLDNHLRSGVMLPNTEWEPWSIIDVTKVIDLQPTVLVVPLYGADNPYQASRNDSIRRLAVVLPNCTMLYRMMASQPITFEPDLWARECATRYIAVGVPGDIVPTNEDNIEGGGEDWYAHNGWWLRFMAALPPNLLGRVHLPALSPTGAYRIGWIARTLIEHLFAAVDIHIYPGSEGDIEAAAATFDKPVWITEFNRLEPAVLGARAVAARVRGLVYFLLRGVNDQAPYTLVEPTYSQLRRLNMFPLSFPLNHVGLADYMSPNYDTTSTGEPAPRPRTDGVVLHATFSHDMPTTETRLQELQATYNWFNNPASQVSAHAIVGVGVVVRPVRKEYIAWHDREYNQHHLGLEFVKRFPGDPIPESDLDLGALVVAQWAQEYGFPLVWDTAHGLTEHRLTPPGIREGKQDIGPDFDHVDFLARVVRFAGMTDAQKKAVLEHLATIDGFRQQVKAVADVAQSAVLQTAQAAILERLVAIKIVLGING